MIRTENTEKAESVLKNQSDEREIIVKDIKEFPDPDYRHYSAVSRIEKEMIEIYINFEYPFEIQEESYVHELLHLILKNEGYPIIFFTEDDFLKIPEENRGVFIELGVNFQTSIEHPEIYSRYLQFFDLNIDVVFQFKIHQQIQNWKSKKSRNEHIKNIYFGNQQEIMQSVQYYYYPNEYRFKILELFKNYYPGPHNSSEILHKKIQKYKFNNPKNCYISAKIIKEHIINYGRRKGIQDINILWETLKIKLP